MHPLSSPCLRISNTSENSYWSEVLCILRPWEISIAGLEKASWCCVCVADSSGRSSCLRLLKIVRIRASERPSKINLRSDRESLREKKLLCVIHGLGGITTNKTKAPDTTSGPSIYTINQLCIKTLAVGNGAARSPSAQQRRTSPCDVHV